MAEVHAGDRKEHGMGDGGYPCATASQCMSAIKLRHNGKSHSAGAVLSHVMSEAAKLRAAGKISPAAYERIKNKVAEARASDKSK
jgi:hypothetical protein